MGELQKETASLRERNREATRSRIIEAYAELSLERGFNNFTMQDIADRVGVSHRTLYRYYEDREAIVDGLYAEIDEKVYGPESDDYLERADVLRHNYQVFGEHRKAMLVGSLMIEAGMLEGPGRATRTAYTAKAVEQHTTRLNDLGRRQLLGLLRVVAGSLAWARMTSAEIGLSDEEAGAASAWALRVLTEAATDHKGDFS